MKKILLILVSLMIFATGCKKEEASNKPSEAIETQKPDEQENSPEQGTVSEYFPIEANKLYSYTGNIELANQKVFPVFIEGNKVQRRTSVNDIVSTEVLKVEDGEVKLVYTNATSNGMENFLNRENPSEIIILKEPLKLNAAWNRSFVSNSVEAGQVSGKSTITAVQVPVETPSGKYEAIEVTTEFETGNSSIEYYAKGVGLVKNEFINIVRDEKGKELSRENVTIELSEIKEDAKCALDLLVYYPDDQVLDLLNETRTIEVSTNEDLRPMFEEILKKPSEGPSSPIITENTKINTISVDAEASEVHLDLSKEFVDEMNAGSGYESMIQESLNYIFADFYRVKSFKLTVEGEDYIPKH